MYLATTQRWDSAFNMNGSFNDGVHLAFPLDLGLDKLILLAHIVVPSDDLVDIF